MKQFIKYPNSYVNASVSNGRSEITDVVQSVVRYLTELGIENINTNTSGYGKMRGYYSGGVRFDFRFYDYDDERRQGHKDWLRDSYPDRYPNEEAAEEFVGQFTGSYRAAYHNFEVLQELYGEAGPDGSGAPIRFIGGGYPQLSAELKRDIETHLKELGYQDVVVKLKRSGLWDQVETLQFYFYIPKLI